MKNKLEIFKNAKDLLDEPEVQDLLDYCDGLEDQIIDFKFEQNKNKTVINTNLKSLQIGLLKAAPFFVKPEFKNL